MTTTENQPAPRMSEARRRLREGQFLPISPAEDPATRSARYDALELCAEDAEEFGYGGRGLSDFERQRIIDRVKWLEDDELSGASARRSQERRQANRARKRQRQRDLYAHRKNYRP